MTDLDAVDRFLDELSLDAMHITEVSGESVDVLHGNVDKAVEALRSVLDLCFVMDGQMTGEGDAEHPVAKMIRERIASKLGVSDD